MDPSGARVVESAWEEHKRNGIIRSDSPDPFHHDEQDTLIALADEANRCGDGPRAYLAFLGLPNENTIEHPSNILARYPPLDQFCSLFSEAGNDGGGEHCRLTFATASAECILPIQAGGTVGPDQVGIASRELASLAAHDADREEEDDEDTPIYMLAKQQAATPTVPSPMQEDEVEVEVEGVNEADFFCDEQVEAPVEAPPPEPPNRATGLFLMNVDVKVHGGGYYSQKPFTQEEASELRRKFPEVFDEPVLTRAQKSRLGGPASAFAESIAQKRAGWDAPPVATKPRVGKRARN